MRQRMNKGGRWGVVYGELSVSLKPKEAFAYNPATGQLCLFIGKKIQKQRIRPRQKMSLDFAKQMLGMLESPRSTEDSVRRSPWAHKVRAKISDFLTNESGFVTAKSSLRFPFGNSNIMRAAITRAGQQKNLVIFEGRVGHSAHSSWLKESGIMSKRWQVTYAGKREDVDRFGQWLQSEHGASGRPASSCP